jgi:hypothetical protein
MQVLTGEMAGWIWHHLDEKGDSSLADLKKHVLKRAGEKFSDINFFTGLGWLMKEQKINMTKLTEKSGEKVMVSLVR